MTDKERIRVEIARINLYSRSEVLENILKFIDSMPKEPACEDLKEKSKKYAIEQVLCTTDTRMCEQAYLSLNIFNGYDVACAYKDGANWQKKQLMKQLAHMPWDKAMDYIVKEGER